jgi:2-methoxy-6-polyprenyl-1,4-benzoquinol methylase
LKSISFAKKAATAFPVSMPIRAMSSSKKDNIDFGFKTVEYDQK